VQKYYTTFMSNKISGQKYVEIEEKEMHLTPLFQQTSKIDNTSCENIRKLWVKTFVQKNVELIPC
jgi:hypothetical protein